MERTMRARAFFVVGVIAIGLTGGDLVAQAEPPMDFALYLETDCPADTIDTSAGEFRRRVGLNEVATASVPLDPAKRAELFRLVTGARLFEYPEKFNPPWEGGFTVPYPHYTIRVVAAGRKHAISWGAIRVPNAEAQRLSQFIRAAYELFRQDPAVRALPPALPCM